MTWVFGYGSLIWRPSFPFAERVHARLPGYVRRFWQGSTDHRGKPGAPGRVVTLVETPGESVDGVAYRLEGPHVGEILASLDHREKGGYERREITVERRDVPGATLVALVYWAGSHNDEYLGPAPLDDMAAQIRGAHGPSGANVDYLLRLRDALGEMGVADRHVEELAAAVGDPEKRLTARTLGAPGLAAGVKKIT